MKFYGTMICNKCVEAKRIIKERNIGDQYQFIDITANVDNMREFLKLRDTRKEFDTAKEEGRIGLPCFLHEDGTITFQVQE